MGDALPLPCRPWPVEGGSARMSQAAAQQQPRMTTTHHQHHIACCGSSCRQTYLTRTCATIDLVHLLQHHYYRHMQHDEALGFAINQQMFAERLTNIDLGRALGISKSTVSRKVRGHVTWSAEEVSLAAHLFGIPVDALMPTPDGSGGWMPAPYVPAGAAQIRRDPTPVGTGSSQVVAGTGFEPATSGL